MSWKRDAILPLVMFAVLVALGLALVFGNRNPSRTDIVDIGRSKSVDTKWCTRTSGQCELSKSACGERWSESQCYEASEYSCFKFAIVGSGEQILSCWNDHGICTEARSKVNSSTRSINVGDCVRFGR